jgi:hypothetical protein
MKTVIVVGLGRGGTSLTTGLLEKIGIDILYSQDEVKKLRHNPKGFFEHDDLWVITREIVKEKENLDVFGEKIVRFVKENSANKKIFGIKNLSIDALSVFLKYFPNPYLIVVVRNSINHTKSFSVFRHVNDDVPIPDFLKILKEIADLHVKLVNILEDFRHLPMIFITFEDIKTDPWKEAKKICDFLNISPTKQMEEEVIRFVDPSLNTWKEVNGNLVPIDPR